MIIDTLNIGVVISRPFMENTFILNLDGRSDCVIVDPGFEPEAIFQYVDGNRLTPTAILNTHGHVDHIAGNEAMKRCWPDVPLVIGEHDAEKLTDAMLNLSGVHGLNITSPPADVLLAEGDVYESAGMSFEVLHTPGHSVGHVVFVWRGENRVVLVNGDVLFQGGVGRTDFPDGSPQQLADSISKKLFPFPDDTVVLTGHGESTTIGDERATFPMFFPESS